MSAGFDAGGPAGRGGFGAGSAAEHAGFDVVVPVGRGIEPAGECIGALRREAGDGLRVVRADFVWQARQEALASSEADVIAFVDADVVVPHGWLDVLRGAWESSPHSIGAIGGPIRADAPAWAHGRLGLIELGDETVELDPVERTLFGGNLSFWRRALSGVGGFPVPVDGRDATDWLAEEHEAQRQLGHWGWLIRYEPSLGAERLIAHGGSVRRAYRYGTRTGIAGSRDRSSAMRQAAKSSAGALAAIARGKRADASERAARAAENLGVALTAGRKEPHSQRGGLTPYTGVGGQTPIRPSGFSCDLVLLYHRFAVGEPDPLGLCVAPERFEAQLRVLADNFEVVPLGEIAATVRSGESGSARVAITIDDGYADNLTAGVPLITGAGLPATLFAATGHIETGRQFFWDEMQRLLTGPGPRPPRLDLEGESWATATPEQREQTRVELHRLVQPRGVDEIEVMLGALREWAGDAGDAARGSGAEAAVGGSAADPARPMTIEQLQEVARMPGIEIGAHTRDHVNLGHQPAAEIRSQVERSRDDVAGWVGVTPRGFSYPFGIPRHDVGDDARAAVAAAGFEYAVVNQPIVVEGGADPYAIPRVFVPDVGADEFAAWLRQLLR